MVQGCWRCSSYAQCAEVPQRCGCRGRSARRVQAAAAAPAAVCVCMRGVSAANSAYCCCPWCGLVQAAAGACLTFRQHSLAGLQTTAPLHAGCHLLTPCGPTMLTCFELCSIVSNLSPCVAHCRQRQPQRYPLSCTATSTSCRCPCCGHVQAAASLTLRSRLPSPAPPSSPALRHHPAITPGV